MTPANPKAFIETAVLALLADALALADDPELVATADTRCDAEPLCPGMNDGAW